jgi:intracellular multiplication protein IcmP
MSQHTGQPKQDDGIIVFLSVIGLLTFIAVVIWMRFHTELTMATIYIRGFFTSPLWVLNVFFASIFGAPLPGIYQLVQTTAELCNPAGSYKFWACTRDPSTVAWGEIQFASFWWNGVYSFIALIVLGNTYYRLQMEHPSGKFNKPHNLESFIKEQTPLYPHLSVFGDLNLLERDNMRGWYRGMDSVREFAFKHKLINGIQHRKIDYVVEGTTQQHTDETEVIPVANIEKLTAIMKKQLGELWIDVDHLEDGEVILLAYYIARAASTQDTMTDKEFYEIEEESLEIENTYWAIAALDVKNKPEFNYDEDDESTYMYDTPHSFDSFPIEDLKGHIKKYIDYPIIKQLLSKHAYARTFIIDVVYEARKLGVMAPTQFRWLKLYDRTLWAMLQNIGRPSLFSECLGANAHYVVETIMGQAMHEPNFIVAVKGWEHQLQYYSYNEQFKDLPIGMIEEMLLNEKGEIADKSPFDRDVFDGLKTNALVEDSPK